MPDAMDIDTDQGVISADVCGNKTAKADSFQAESDRFMAWLKARPGVYVNPNIAVIDLRTESAGRGISTFTFTLSLPSFSLL